MRMLEFFDALLSKVGFPFRIQFNQKPRRPPTNNYPLFSRPGRSVAWSWGRSRPRSDDSDKVVKVSEMKSPKTWMGQQPALSQHLEHGFGHTGGGE